MRKFLVTALIVAAATPAAFAQFINTNNLTTYNAFASGATVQTFESVAGRTPQGLSAYTDGTAIGTAAQLGGQIAGLHFHSGGANPNNTAASPGTPTALLQLQGAISGNARSGSNVVAPLEINTETLGLAAGDFLEIVFTTAPVGKAGFWLNPALGSVTFSAFDATLTSLGSGTGTAGNFVGFQSATNNIKFISVVAGSASGFTIDDLTYGAAGTPGTPPGNGAAIPEPGTLSLLGIGLMGAWGWGKRTRRSKS